MEYGTRQQLAHGPSLFPLLCIAAVTLFMTALPAAPADSPHSRSPQSDLCCITDASGLSKQCTALKAVPSMLGGDGRDASPSHLMRCVNDANRTRGATPPPWIDEIAHVQAASAWWSPRTSPYPVTVVTHLSVGRLPQLWAQCLSWPGPLSAAVYIPRTDGTPMTKKQLWCAMQQTYMLYQQALDYEGACALDLILLYELRSGHVSMNEYPVNVLRNMARLQARTETVAMIDVDMLMSREMVRWLGVPDNMHELEQQCQARIVYVLPAFEVLGNNTHQAATMADHFSTISKASLMTGVHNRTLSSFAAVRYSRGHAATNFPRWAMSADPYVVPYAAGFEPWVLTHRTMAPWHDARFRGYGLNKVSYIAHLNASGYKFVVHPNAFIIHRAHNSSQARKRFNSDMVNYYRSHRHSDLSNGVVYRSLSEQKQQMNTYFKVNHLFAVIKQEMDRGAYMTVVDPATRRCRKMLPWWPGNSRWNFRHKSSSYS